jgi:hypothetical protein
MNLFRLTRRANRLIDVCVRIRRGELIVSPELEKRIVIKLNTLTSRLGYETVERRAREAKAVI